MTKDNPNQEQPDPLSATGMFLRAFDVEGEKKPSDPFAPAPPSARPPNAAGERPPYPAPPPPPQAGGQGAGQSEFTQMFNSQAPRPAPPPAPNRQPRLRPPCSGPLPIRVRRLLPPTSRPASSRASLFRGSLLPRRRRAGQREDPPRPVPPSSATFVGSAPSSGSSRAKGFSSPGISDSADGGFTQFFSAPARPAPPPQSAAPPPPPPPRPQPAPDMSWRDDPFFRAPEKAPEQPSQSVTSILSSLSSPAGSGSRPPEPAPYRPEPLPSYAPPKPSEPSPADPGGVTRLIQRLAQEQSAPAAPPQFAPEPPPDSGPGEFTRIMAAPASRPAMSGPPAPGAAPPPPAPMFAAPPPPAMPKVAPPPFAPPPFAAPPPAAAPHPPAFAAPPPPAFAAPAHAQARTAAPGSRSCGAQRQAGSHGPHPAGDQYFPAALVADGGDLPDQVEVGGIPRTQVALRPADPFPSAGYPPARSCR